MLVDRLAHLVLTKTDTVSAGQDRLAHLVLTKTDTVSAGQDRLAHLVDKDRHSEGWSRQVSIEVLQVVLPLALPGQVHQGGPFAPPQLYQFPLLIYACIEARHLQNHDAHGIELVADGIKLVAHGIQLVADGIPQPSQVHQGWPLAPPQLYQLPLLISACIKGQHLHDHDAHGIQLTKPET